MEKRSAEELPSPKESHGAGSGEEAAMVSHSDVPDGGLTAWMTLAGQWFILFATFGYLYSFGVYQDYYTRIYLTTHSPSSISFQFMMPFFLGLIAGKLHDDGYFHHLEIIGSIFFTVSLFMLSLAKPFQYYQIFLSQAVGMGIGLGLTFIPTVSLTVHHWRRWRGFASGVALTGSSLTTTTIILVLNRLFERHPFGVAVRASGYVVLACLVLGNALVRTRLPPKSSAGPPPNVKAWLHEGPFVWAIIAGLFASLGFYFPVIYMQLYAVQHDVDPNLAFYSLAILNGSGAFGRLIGNLCSDLYGPYNMMLIASLGTFATIWAMLGINTGASLVVVSVLYGIFSGAWLSLCVATLAFLSKTPSETGARTGIGIAFSCIGTLTSAPIQGALLTSEFRWIRPIAFAATVMLGSTVSFLMTRMLLAKERGTHKV